MEKRAPQNWCFFHPFCDVYWYPFVQCCLEPVIFFYHIDVYQGKNIENIDIHLLLHNLPATHKAVDNAIIKGVIANDPHVSIHIYMNILYADPQLFALT